MKNTEKITILGFLRGINVGGHHKVPMAELRQILTDMGFANVKTLLNSGNTVFETDQSNIEELESKIETHLNQQFKFSIPLILKSKNEILELVQKNPFEAISLHTDLRLYVSFLKTSAHTDKPLPYRSDDGGFEIISIHMNCICSVLDLSKTKTPDGMKVLENIFGKNITTRNWNTLLKMVAM